MADYSLGYGGIGSGLDITGMVEQLVAADRKPAEQTRASSALRSTPSPTIARWQSGKKLSASIAR